MRRKVKKHLKSKKIVVIIALIFISILVIIGVCNINKNNTKPTNSELIEKSEYIPEVTLDNTKFEISETDLTIENIIIKVSSKLENYNLYYFIDTLENENEEVEEETSESYILYEDKIEVESNSNIYFKYELYGKYSDNSYKLEINNIQKEELDNEDSTDKEIKNNEVSNTVPYYIIVNYSSNVVTIYVKDENGEYTVPVKAMVCSTGVATPRSGVYKLPGTRAKWGALFGGVYGQYTVKIVGNILFHSVPYLSRDNSTLEYWEYDKLGTTASAGCIRLTVEDALWIYNNCGSGTQVEFSADAPNPLGKPSARKISGYENLRGYDPTDPVSNNPWRNSTSQTEKTNNSEEENITQIPTVDKVNTETKLPSSEISDFENKQNSTNENTTEGDSDKTKNEDISNKEENQEKEE